MDSPQILYLILVVPGIFGLTLGADGIYKIFTNKNGGYITFLFGVMFLGVVAFSYYFFTVYLLGQP